MKLRSILSVVNDYQFVSIIDQFGNSLFKRFRVGIHNSSIPDADVIEIASSSSILIIEVKTCE